MINTALNSTLVTKGEVGCGAPVSPTLKGSDRTARCSTTVRAGHEHSTVPVFDEKLTSSAWDDPVGFVYVRVPRRRPG